MQHFGRIWLGFRSSSYVQNAVWSWCRRRWFGVRTVQTWSSLFACLFSAYLQWYSMHWELWFVLATHVVHNGSEEWGFATNKKLETNSHSQNHIQNFCQNASWSFATSAGKRAINGPSWFSTRHWYWPRAGCVWNCLWKKRWMECRNLVCKLGLDQGLWSCWTWPSIPSIEGATCSAALHCFVEGDLFFSNWFGVWR